MAHDSKQVLYHVLCDSLVTDRDETRPRDRAEISLRCLVFFFQLEFSVLEGLATKWNS